MAIVSKSKFSTIAIPVDATTALEDVAITVSSDSNKASLELGSNSYTSSIANGTLSIKPNKVWLGGILIEVVIANQTYKDSFKILKNRYEYDPEQELYSKGIYDTATDDNLVSSGLATEIELELLNSMGPNLTAIWDKFSTALCTKFIYDNTTPNLRICRLVSFRCMQQLALMLGLESLVEYLLFSPGPPRSWFRTANIVAARLDYQVLESIKELQGDIASLANTMTLAGLNTDVIESIDYQLDSSSDYHTLAKNMATLFCGLRYTHDNTKFSY